MYTRKEPNVMSQSWRMLWGECQQWLMQTTSWGIWWMHSCNYHQNKWQGRIAHSATWKLDLCQKRTHGVIYLWIQPWKQSSSKSHWHKMHPYLRMFWNNLIWCLTWGHFTRVNTLQKPTRTHCRSELKTKVLWIRYIEGCMEMGLVISCPRSRKSPIHSQIPWIKSGGSENMCPR